MSSYLMKLAQRLIEIRRIMNWSQEHLAQIAGISRPTLINIEKGSVKLTRGVAIVIFVMILHELNNRNQRLRQLDYQRWDRDRSQRETLINEIKRDGNITASLIGFSPEASHALSSSIGLITSIFMKPYQAIEANDINANHIHTVVEETLNQIHNRIKSIFEIKSLDVIEFINRLESADLKQ